MEVLFIDVGQGDAALIKSPQGHHILIDGGPGEAVLEKLGEEISFFDQSIDLVILTHPHYDHISGVIEAISRYDVENIIYTGVRDETSYFREWDSMVEDYYLARAGMRVSANDFYIDILYPFDDLEGYYAEDSNETSVASRLVFKDHSFLFTGDLYSSQEEEIVFVEEWCKENEASFCRAFDLSSDVLKVGHHGSNTSTSREFVEAVLPRVAIISCGKDNRYGHPDSRVLETLEDYGISVRRTDLEGDIRIIAD